MHPKEPELPNTPSGGGDVPGATRYSVDPGGAPGTAVDQLWNNLDLLSSRTMGVSAAFDQMSATAAQYGEAGRKLDQTRLMMGRTALALGFRSMRLDQAGIKIQQRQVDSTGKEIRARGSIINTMMDEHKLRKRLRREDLSSRSRDTKGRFVEGIGAGAGAGGAGGGGDDYDSGGGGYGGGGGGRASQEIGSYLRELTGPLLQVMTVAGAISTALETRGKAAEFGIGGAMAFGISGQEFSDPEAAATRLREATADFYDMSSGVFGRTDKLRADAAELTRTWGMEFDKVSEIQKSVWDKIIPATRSELRSLTEDVILLSRTFQTETDTMVDLLAHLKNTVGMSATDASRNLFAISNSVTQMNDRLQETGVRRMEIDAVNKVLFDLVQTMGDFGSSTQTVSRIFTGFTGQLKEFGYSQETALKRARDLTEMLLGDSAKEMPMGIRYALQMQREINQITSGLTDRTEIESVLVTKLTAGLKAGTEEYNQQLIVAKQLAMQTGLMKEGRADMYTISQANFDLVRKNQKTQQQLMGENRTWLDEIFGFAQQSNVRAIKAMIGGTEETALELAKVAEYGREDFTKHIKDMGLLGDEAREEVIEPMEEVADILRRAKPGMYLESIWEELKSHTGILYALIATVAGTALLQKAGGIPGLAGKLGGRGGGAAATGAATKTGGFAARWGSRIRGAGQIPGKALQATKAGAGALQGGAAVGLKGAGKALGPIGLALGLVEMGVATKGVIDALSDTEQITIKQREVSQLNLDIEQAKADGNLALLRTLQDQKKEATAGLTELATAQYGGAARGVGGAAGGVIGGMGGMATGAMAGAAVGSVVPIIGTAIGGVVGGIIGGFGGGALGHKMGGSAADAFMDVMADPKRAAKLENMRTEADLIELKAVEKSKKAQRDLARLRIREAEVSQRLAGYNDDLTRQYLENEQKKITAQIATNEQTTITQQKLMDLSTSLRAAAEAGNSALAEETLAAARRLELAAQFEHLYLDKGSITGLGKSAMEDWQGDSYGSRKTTAKREIEKYNQDIQDLVQESARMSADQFGILLQQRGLSKTVRTDEGLREVTELDDKMLMLQTAFRTLGALKGKKEAELTDEELQKKLQSIQTINEYTSKGSLLIAETGEVHALLGRKAAYEKGQKLIMGRRQAAGVQKKADREQRRIEDTRERALGEAEESLIYEATFGIRRDFERKRLELLKNAGVATAKELTTRITESKEKKAIAEKELKQQQELVRMTDEALGMLAEGADPEIVKKYFATVFGEDKAQSLLANEQQFRSEQFDRLQGLQEQAEKSQTAEERYMKADENVNTLNAKEREAIAERKRKLLGELEGDENKDSEWVRKVKENLEKAREESQAYLLRARALSGSPLAPNPSIKPDRPFGEATTYNQPPTMYIPPKETSAGSVQRGGEGVDGEATFENGKLVIKVKNFPHTLSKTNDFIQQNSKKTRI